MEKLDRLKSAGTISEAEYSRACEPGSCSSQGLRVDPKILCLAGAGVEPILARALRYCET
jgi:hypothetical protein